MENSIDVAEYFMYLTGSPVQQFSQEEMKFSSSFTYNTAGSSSHSLTLGRSKNRFTLILEHFKTKKSHKPPKKEFFNTFIIRAIKRAFRCLIYRKIPEKTCIKIDLLNPVQAESWEEIGRIYRENYSLIEEISKTENGPETDGKRKRKKGAGPESVSKSFNNSYCKSFFSEVLVQRAFRAIFNILFSEFEPSILMERFGFRCCSEKGHEYACNQKWEKLRDYLDRYYFEDLEVRLVGDDTGIECSDFILEDPN